MKKFVAVSVIAVILLVGTGVGNAADEGTVRPDCNEPDCGPPPCQPCVKMKICRVVVYDEQERTFYRPVYTEKVEERIIDAVEYVEETRYRCKPCTVLQPKPSCCAVCAPAEGACGTCAPAKPCEMVEVQILRKVPYTVVVPKNVQKTKKVPRTVVTMEPYTVTVCIPRVAYMQVPVCSPPCCGKQRCGKPACCGD